MSNAWIGGYHREKVSNVKDVLGGRRSFDSQPNHDGAFSINTAFFLKLSINIVFPENEIETIR
jgi:hypothetical protein